MSKISATEIALLSMFALTADVATLIPIVNVLVTLTVSPALYFYWKIKRVPAYPTIIAGAIEVVPLISMLPTITGGVLAVILINKLRGKLPSSTASSPRDARENIRQRKLNAQQDLRNEERRQAAGYGDQRQLHQLQREAA